MVPGLDRYIGDSTILLSLLRFGSSPRSCSRCHGRLRGHPIVRIAYGERRSRSWQPSSLRSGLSALLLRSQPRAIFFPGTAWVGLAAVAFLPGIVLSTHVLSFAPTLRCSDVSLSPSQWDLPSAVASCSGRCRRLLADGLRSILTSAMSPNLSRTSRRLSLSSRKRPSLRRESSSFRNPLSPGGPKQRRCSGDNRLIAAERAAKYSRSEQGYRPGRNRQKTIAED